MKINLCFFFSLIVIFLILSIISGCQKKDNNVTNPIVVTPTWSKTIGGINSDITSSIQSTSDGGCIVVGSTLSYGAGNDDGFAMKIDAGGNVQWFNVFGGSGVDDINSVQPTQDGGYILAGQTNSFGATQLDVWSVKLYGDGNIAWSKFYRLPGNDYGMSVRQTDDGGFVIAGYTDSYGAGNDDALVIKTDASGNIQWAKVYGGQWNDYATSIKTFHNPTSYIVAGYSYSNPLQSNSDVLLMSLYGDGVLNWAKFYGGSGDDKANDIQITRSNGYVVAGVTYSYGAGGGDVYIFTTDGNGNIIWSKTMGGANLDEALSVVQNIDGRFVVTGKTSSFGSGNSDIFVLQLDGFGMFNWMKVFGGVNIDIGTGIAQRSDGNYVVSGITASYGSGNNDAYIFNLKKDGTCCLPDNNIVPTGGDPVTTVSNATSIIFSDIRYETDNAPVIFNPIAVTVKTQCNNP